VLKKQDNFTLYQYMYVLSGVGLNNQTLVVQESSTITNPKIYIYSLQAIANCVR